MGRFILRFGGATAVPAADVERIRSHEGVTVLDSASRTLLVEGPESELRELAQAMPGWIISPERSIYVPDPRPRPVRAPTRSAVARRHKAS